MICQGKKYCDSNWTKIALKLMFCCFCFLFWWVVLLLLLILLLWCWCSRFVTCVAVVDEYWCVGVVDLSVVVVVVVDVVRVGVDEERRWVWRHGYGYGAMVWLRLGSAEADQPSREEGGPCGQQLVATLGPDPTDDDKLWAILFIQKPNEFVDEWMILGS